MPAPRGDKWEIDIERRLKQLEERASHPFYNTGLSIPEPGVTQVDGNLHVLGDFTADGKIGDEALANPLRVASTVGSAVGFAVSTTPTKRAEATLTVPNGFSQAVILCFANGNAFNDTASVDFLTVQAAVNGATGGGVIATIGAGSYGTTVTGVRTSTLSGLNGGDTVTAEAWAASQNAGWSANAANFLFINAFALWLR